MKLKDGENRKDQGFTAYDFLRFLSDPELLQRLISQSMGKEMQSKALAEAVGEWLIELKIGERSSATVSFYRFWISTFVNRVGPEKLLSEITPSDLKYHLIETIQRGPFAHHACYRTLRAFLNWAKEQKYIIATPLTIRAPKLPETMPEIFSEQEMRQIIKACNNLSRRIALRDKAVVLTFYDTGMRVSELAAMKMGDINPDTRLIKIRGKGRKERMLSLSPPTMKAIWEYLKAMRPRMDNLWFSEEGRPLTSSGIQQIVRRIIRRAGIRGRKAGPHTFRHTFACRYLEAGGDPITLQYLLGHSSLRMVERYVRAVKARYAVKLQERFSPVEREGLG